jgi:hypothetical protein
VTSNDVPLTRLGCRAASSGTGSCLLGGGLRSMSPPMQLRGVLALVALCIAACGPFSATTTEDLEEILMADASVTVSGADSGLGPRASVLVRVHRPGFLRLGLDEYPKPGRTPADLLARKDISEPFRVVQRGGQASGLMQFAVNAGDEVGLLLERMRFDEKDVPHLLRTALGVRDFDHAQNRSLHELQKVWGVRPLEVWRQTVRFPRVAAVDGAGPWLFLPSLDTPETSDEHEWSRVSTRAAEYLLSEGSGPTAVWVEGWRRRDVEETANPANDGSWICRVLWVHYVAEGEESGHGD